MQKLKHPCGDNNEGALKVLSDSEAEPSPGELLWEMIGLGDWKISRFVPPHFRQILPVPTAETAQAFFLRALAGEQLTEVYPVVVHPSFSCEHTPLCDGDDLSPFYTLKRQNPQVTFKVLRVLSATLKSSQGIPGLLEAMRPMTEPTEIEALLHGLMNSLGTDDAVILVYPEIQK